VHQADVAEELAGRGYDDKAGMVGLPPHAHTFAAVFCFRLHIGCYLTAVNWGILAYSHVLA